jgi:hypothetical protein
LNTRNVKFSPLIEYVIRGLRNCWLPDKGRWSHIYHLDGRVNPNESIPPSDVFYSLNVLLGLSRLGKNRFDLGYDLQDTFETNVVAMCQLPVPKYAYGMALWAGAELNLSLPNEPLLQIEKFINDRENWARFRAQDLGMILIGVIAQQSRESSHWEALAHALFGFLVQRFSCPSGLFYDEAFGLRRRWASFATQTYLTLACYSYAEAFCSDEALRLALACTSKMIALQGQNGEWPWFFDVPQARVVDFYEIYSVHQDGMAPAFLEHAERHGLPGAKDALCKGFFWIYGQNEMRKSMLMPQKSLIVRSHVRRGELHNKSKRVFRALRNTVFHSNDQLVGSDQIELRLECRSYHLGWVIWSFAQRVDVPEITGHVALEHS